MPDATPDWVAHVIERGLAHASESGFEAVELEVDRADDVMREVLVGHGFAIEERRAMVESWLAADARPEISPLHDDYRLVSRLDTMQRPHHMIERAWTRRRDSVSSRHRCIAPTSICSFSTATTTSLRTGCSGTTLRPPRVSSNPCAPKTITSDEDLPATSSPPASTCSPRPAQSASRSVFEPDNPASSHLYLSVGFEPVKQTDTFSGRPSAGAS